MLQSVIYDPTPYTDTDAEFVWCRVEITLPDGETRTAVGDYLNLDGDRARLMCGIYEMGADLGLPVPETTLKIHQVVNRQLVRRPWAVMVCPELSARLELVTPPVQEED